jgi:hypothetical protein
MNWARAIIFSFSQLLMTILPFVLGLFFLILFSQFFESSRKIFFRIVAFIPEPFVKPVFISSLVFLALVILNSIVVSQRKMGKGRSAAIELLAECGWTETNQQSLTSVVSSFDGSEILFSVSLVSIDSPVIFKKQNMLFWFGDETRRQAGGLKRVIKGATISYLIVPLKKGFPETVLLGSFGSTLRKNHFTRIGYSKAADIEGYSEVLSKSGIVEAKVLEIAKTFLKVSLVRSNENKSMNLNLDENPDIEFYPTGIVFRFVGPLNPEFIELLDVALADLQKDG